MKHSNIEHVVKIMLKCLVTKTCSLRDHISNTFDCTSPYIIHCRPSYNNSRADHYSSFPFCGNIRITPKSDLSIKLYLHVLRKHIIHFDFLQFLFRRSYHICGPDQLQILDQAEKVTHVYCGCRLPWNIISTGRRCDIIVNVLSGSTSQMMLFYQAIYKSHITSVMFVSDWHMFKTPLIVPLLQKVQTYMFMLSALVFEVMHVNVVWTNNEGSENITIFDGPGRRSSIIMALDEKDDAGVYKTVTSVFSMVILVKKTMYRYDATQFHMKTVETKRMQRCKSAYATLFGFRLTMIQEKFKSRGTNDNFICRIKTTYDSRQHNPVLEIQKFVFIDANTLESLLNVGCSYGGIFIRTLDKNASLIETPLCENKTRFFWNPPRSKVKVIELFFVWYQGYSRVRFKGHIQYIECPTTRITSNLLKSYFDPRDSCHIYTCYDKLCVMRLTNHGQSFGPSELEIVRFSYMQLDMSFGRVHQHALAEEEQRCKSEVMTSSVEVKKQSVDHLINKHHVFNNNSHSFLEMYPYLQNVSVLMKTCETSPFGS